MSLTPVDTWYSHIVVSDELLQSVSGNASLHTKKLVLQAWLLALSADSDTWAPSVLRRVRVVSVNIGPSEHEPQRSRARVICEVPVEAHMVDAEGNLAVAVLTTLLDNLSMLANIAEGTERKRSDDFDGVSQSLQYLFHAPAPLGTLLQVDNVCLTLGTRSFSSRAEARNSNTGELVATVVQLKMSSGLLKNLLAAKL